MFELKRRHWAGRFSPCSPRAPIWNIAHNKHIKYKIYYLQTFCSGGDFDPAGSNSKIIRPKRSRKRKKQPGLFPDFARERRRDPHRFKKHEKFIYFCRPPDANSGMGKARRQASAERGYGGSSLAPRDYLI